MRIPPTTLPYNFDKTDWDLLKSILQQALPSQTLLDLHPTPDQLDKYADTITQAILYAIGKTTPRRKPTPHSKRWWTQELTDMRKTVNNKRNAYRRSNNEVDRREWKAYRQIYKEEIARAKERK